MKMCGNAARARREVRGGGGSGRSGQARVGSDVETQDAGKVGWPAWEEVASRETAPGARGGWAEEGAMVEPGAGRWGRGGAFATEQGIQFHREGPQRSGCHALSLKTLSIAICK